MMREWKYLVPLIAFTFLVYSNIFSNVFLWDDRILIHNNQNLHDPSKHILFIRDFWAVDPINTGSPYFRPLVSLLYIADFHIWGEEDPFGYHLTNILVHIIATVGVFYLVREIFGSSRFAFLSSLFFGIHPIHTESVTWIAGRTDLLMGAFFFWAMYFYAKFRNTDLKKYLYWSLTLFTFSILSKEVAVTFPLVIVFYDWCRQKNWKVIFAQWKTYALFFAVIPAYTLLRIWALQGGNYVFTKSILREFLMGNFFEPIMKFVYSVLYYAYLSFWPFTLKARHVMPESYPLLSAHTLTAIVFVVLSIFVLIYLYRNHRTGFFFAGFFVLNVLLVANLFTIKDSFAERFAYLASLSACIAIPCILEWFDEKIKVKSFFVTLCLLFLVLFGASTLERNTHWKNPLSLWQQEVKVNPFSSNAHMLLGVAWLNVNQTQQAIHEFSIAISLNPNEYEAYMNRAGILLYLGEVEAAHADFREMFRINPHDHKSPFGVGHTLALMGKFSDAIPFLERAYVMKPQNEFYKKALDEATYYAKQASLQTNTTVSPGETTSDES